MKYLLFIIPIVAMFLLSFVWYEAKPYFHEYPWIELPTFVGCIALFVVSVFFVVDKQ